MSKRHRTSSKKPFGSGHKTTRKFHRPTRKWKNCLGLVHKNIFGSGLTDPKISKPHRTSSKKRFRTVLGPSPTKPTKCKPLKASCPEIAPRCRAGRGRGENCSPQKTFVSQEVLSVLPFFDFVGPGPTGSGFLRGARLLSHFHGICIAAPFQHCSRAAFARNRASQNGINFRSADGHSSAMTLEVMRFPGASGAFGRGGRSSSDCNPRSALPRITLSACAKFARR